MEKMIKMIKVDNLRSEDGFGVEDEVYEITIKELKKSKEEFFKLKPNSKAVYILGCYDRSRKGYYITNYETMSERFIKSNCKIYVGFCY